jgi:hypothetical protein
MSQVNTNAIYDASGGQSAKLYGVSMRDGGTGWVNRIINGNMVIDQRNAGASVTSNGATYTLDRWQAYSDVGSKYTVQRSTDAPSNFTNSLLATSSSAYTVGTNEVYGLFQFIEGFNTADLKFGSATASAVTLSFWVKSSLTGTFGGSLVNSGYTRAYPFTYTISAANTWEQKTLTIAGDTTGTWLTNNGTGIGVIFGLGCGSGRSATAGSWTGTNLVFSATGATSVVGTNGATFYITGVQLEAGSVASPFERIDYGRQLIQCQRYYYKKGPTGSDGFTQISFANITTTTNHRPFIELPVQMRTAPTSLDYSSVGFITTWGSGVAAASALAIDRANPNGVELTATNAALGTAGGMSIFLQNNNSGGYVALSAEL